MATRLVHFRVICTFKQTFELKQLETRYSFPEGVVLLRGVGSNGQTYRDVVGGVEVLACSNTDGKSDCTCVDFTERLVCR
jgi:hypothetical protein